MDRFVDIVKKFFDASDGLQAKLSLRWREHANRRTLIAIVAIGFLATLLYLTVIRPPASFPINQLVTVP